jgi:hypothetical protein
MRKVLKWVGIGFVALLVLLAALWSLSRWMTPTREQKQALAVLAQQDTPAGRNAFPAIWLLPYNVPEDQLEAVTAEDAEKFRRQTPVYGLDYHFDGTSVAEEKFGRVAGTDVADTKRCNMREPGCLTKVRADPAGYAQWKQDNQVLFDRAQAIAKYDYYRNTFPVRPDMPFPAFQHALMSPTMHAVDFVEGRTDQAVDGVCRDLGMWRKFLKENDSLIVSMIAAAGIRGNSTLLAEMLQELPADYSLPESCVVATGAPVVEELSLCNAMRGEAVFSFNTQQMVGTLGNLTGKRWIDIFAPLLDDPKGTQAMTSPIYAWPCSQEAKKQITSDQPVKTPFQPIGLAHFECIGNAAGCVLRDAVMPVYDDYFHRSQDTGAQLKLLGTLLWLREHTDDRRPLAERLASRPDELKSPTRDIEIVDGGKALSIRMFEVKRNKTFELPLPGYLQDNAGTQ